MERRTRRSSDRLQALQHLVEAVARRSEVEAVALVNETGRVVAGVGDAQRLESLGSLAMPMARGEFCADFEAATDGTDFFTREIELAQGSLFLAALGTRVRKMSDAAKAVARICGPAWPA
jgi:hypothetical protein